MIVMLLVYERLLLFCFGCLKGSYIIAWGATPGHKVFPKTIQHPVGVQHLPGALGM